MYVYRVSFSSFFLSSFFDSCFSRARVLAVVFPLSWFFCWERVFLFARARVRARNEHGVFGISGLLIRIFLSRRYGAFTFFPTLLVVYSNSRLELKIHYTVKSLVWNYVTR